MWLGEQQNKKWKGYKGPFVRYLSKTNIGETIKNEKFNWDYKAVDVTKGRKKKEKGGGGAYVTPELRMSPNNCKLWLGLCVVFWPLTRPKMPFQGDAPEGSDTF